MATGTPWQGVAGGGDFEDTTDGVGPVTGEAGEVMGTSVSLNHGRTWTRISRTGYHPLDCTRDGSCWAAGGGGRVARIAR